MTSHAWIDEAADLPENPKAFRELFSVPVAAPRFDFTEALDTVIRKHVNETFRRIVVDEEEVARIAVERGHGYGVIVGTFGQRAYVLHPAIPRWSCYEFPTAESYELWHESVTNPRKARRRG